MNMRKRFSRVVSAALCLTLLAAHLPAQAFAAEDQGELEPAVLTESQTAPEEPAAPAETEGEGEPAGEEAQIPTDNDGEEEPPTESGEGQEPPVDGGEDEAPPAEDGEGQEAPGETADEAGAEPMTFAVENGVQPLVETEYTKEFKAGGLDDYGFNSVSFKVTTTDEKGAELETATGSVVMEEKGEEYDAIVAQLIEQGVAVDPRSTYLFRFDCKDADGDPIDLDDTKTTMAVTSNWFFEDGSSFEVYVYDGETVSKETSGTHEITDYSEWGIPALVGMVEGNDAFTVNGDNALVLYVQTLKEHEPLAPGSYSISANMTVLGKNNAVLPGIQVYISSEDVPPTVLEKNNAELVVAEDGTMTLTLRDFNQVFTLQSIKSGTDVIIKDRIMDEGFKTRMLQEMDSSDLGMLANLKDDSRINGLVMELKNYNGFYRFTNCLEYPLPIGDYMNMQIDLLVDFDSAIPGYSRPTDGQKEYSRDFTDQATGITVHVDTTEAFGEKLEKATLKVNKVTSGEAIYRMERLYLGDTYQIYHFRLLDESGNEIVMEGNSQAKIDNWNIGQWLTPVVHQFEEDSAPEIVFNFSDSKVSFTLRHLGEVAVVGTLTKVPYKAVHYGHDYGDAIVTGSATSVSADGSFNMTVYAMYDTSGGYMYNGYQLYGNRWLDNVSGLLGKKEETGIGTKYYMGFQEDNAPFNSLLDRNSRIEVELPYDASKPYYYFVMTDGTETYVRQFTDTWRHGENVVFYLINALKLEDTIENDRYEGIMLDDGSVYGNGWAETMLTALYNGQMGRTPSASTKVAYILQSDKKLAGMPVQRIEKSYFKINYNAEKQTPYWLCDVNTVFSGDFGKKNAGEYTATVTPKVGYTWIDGTTEPKTMSWKIEKNTLRANYVGETIHEGGQPKLQFKVYGWMGDDNEETAEGFVKPTLTAPESLPVGEYTLKPEGGSADNYEFSSYGSGTLRVVANDVQIIDKPTATDYIADGEEHIGVPEGEGYTLSGTAKERLAAVDNDAIRGKEYEATATLKDGYIWSDGTAAPVSFAWCIYKKAEMPKLPITVTYTGITIDIHDEIKSEGIYASGDKAANIGEYEGTIRVNTGYCWPESTQDNILTETRPLTWSIVAAGTTDPSTPTTPTDRTQTVTANLYLPGEDNKVLGITVYLNNANNPIQGTGTPTTPKSNNARLKTAADGTRTLTLAITNPVFTLQAIDGCSNARIVSTKTSSNLVYQGNATGKYSTRISEITVELLDDSGEYVFENCIEFPTLLNQEWNAPLILAVNFEGGTDDSLDSNDNVDTSAITGGNKAPAGEEGAAVTLNPAVTAGRDGVANVELTRKELDAALEQVREDGGAIVIEPEIKGDAGKVNVDLPKAAAEAMAKADTDLVVKTGAAAVTVPAGGLAEIAKAEGSTVTVSTEKVDDAVAVSIAVGGKAVETVKGGILVTVSAAKQNGNVLVLVDADGGETVVKKSVVAGDTVKAILNGPATVKVADRRGTFADTADHWAAAGIAFAVSHELFQGVDEDRFAPDVTMSRAMLATVLHRLEGAEETGGSTFTDVAGDAWYADGVAWASEKGIVTGIGDGTFAPNDDVTREQLVVMLYRYAKYLGMDTGASADLKAYTDADDVSSWAEDAMAWAVAKGLISGRSGALLAPGGTATRAETATILQRMVELMVK